MARRAPAPAPARAAANASPSARFGERERTLLQSGIQKLGLDIDSPASERLLTFAQLLGDWSTVHNLTALRSADEVLTHHLLDSLAVLPALDRWCARLATAGVKPVNLIDVGAGGGLPGLPIAIARPDLPVTLVDKVGKKVAFIRQAQLELGLPNVTPLHARVEDVDTRFALVCSRAFASLADFVTLTRPVLAPGGRWLALKGPAYTDELAALPPDVRVDETITLAVPYLDEQRHLLVLAAA